MGVELDHVFLCVSVGAPEAELLGAAGVTEGQPNRHPGQGTACRRFFFANAYLELLWVEDAAEVQGEPAGPLRLWERWSRRAEGACPFGLVFRTGQPVGPLPFPAWRYRPPYLARSSDGLHIGMSSECVEEPQLACFRGGCRPDARSAEGRQPLEHKAGLRELTALRLFSPYTAARSAALRAAEQTGAFGLLAGPEYLAELGFDGERQGRRADLRPALPLALCW
jgi:hypothetical protein